MSAASDPQSAAHNPYRLLPRVDALLMDPRFATQRAQLGDEVLGDMIRAVLGTWRERIASLGLDARATEKALLGDRIVLDLEKCFEREARRGVVRAINLSGVVLNTGLGRAPVHPEVAQRMAEVAGGYCVLEVDRDTGQRNQRDARLGELLGRLTGAEAGIAVNNNAAAVLLVMHAFAKGKEAIVSRGELVEIGGSFRIPEVLESAGARLVAVGATNRTRLADYQAAIVQATGLLLKVHTSNFRVVGFTEEVDAADLARLGRERGIPSAWDLGSGRLEARAAASLERVGGETEVRTAVASGVDVVTFSGDKLLGGPQAGLLVGNRAAIARLRACPMYRALRLDKVALAGLERTVELLLEGRGDELPTRAMLLMEKAETAAACALVRAALADLPRVKLVEVDSESQPGSGSAPTVRLPGRCLKLEIEGLSAQGCSQALRQVTPPVFTRVQADAVWLDPRTLLAGDLQGLRQAVEAVVQRAQRNQT